MTNASIPGYGDLITCQNTILIALNRQLNQVNLQIRMYLKLNYVLLLWVVATFASALFCPNSQSSNHLSELAYLMSHDSKYGHKQHRNHCSPIQKKDVQELHNLLSATNELELMSIKDLIKTHAPSNNSPNVDVDSGTEVGDSESSLISIPSFLVSCSAAKKSF